MRTLLLVTLLLLPTLSGAARLVAVDQPVSVRLEVAQPTALVFPEPVTSLTTGLTKERISADFDGPYVFVMAKDAEVSGRLFVVGASGKLYPPVTFKVTTPADDTVTLTTAPQSGRGPLPAFGVPSLLRALRLQSPVPGQEIVEAPAPTLPDSRVILVHTSAVQVQGTIGAIYLVRNTQATALPLDLRIGRLEPALPDTLDLGTWVWPPRLTIRMVAADTELLAPGAATRIYVVLERRP